ncbi:ABC transporter family substrate-binding protein [Nocardioides panacihumi]|uniref:ABC transporter family substrate-binding protein n=2 Tax=Nocardioides panacihumi TaxID=400774 RepID=A0ABN2RUK2_9ACTN
MVNSAAAVKSGGTATYTITLPITNWNVLNAGGATYSVIDISNLLEPSAYLVQPDGSVVMNDQLLKSATEVKSDPQTIKYEINPNAKWSDGTPIDASDFIYNWQVQDPRQCPACAMALAAGYDRIKTVTGSNGGKTVTVVFDTPFSEWQSLFSTLLPAHVAATYGPVGTPAGRAKSFNEGFVKNPPKWSGGPFRVDQFTSDGSVVTVRNDNWYGPRSNLDSIVFRLITDPAEQPTALRNGEVDVIFPTPGVDLLKQVQAIDGVAYQMSPAPQVRDLYLNMNADALKDKALRQAIFTAIDLPGLVKKTIGQFDPTAKPLKDHLFLPGTPGYADDVTALGYGAGDAAAAKDILKSAGYSGIGTKLVAPGGKAVPELRMPVSNANSLAKDEAQLIKAALAPLGITVAVKPSPNPLGNLQDGTWEILDGTLGESPFVASMNQAYYSSCPTGVKFCNFNVSNYGNSEVDKRLSGALSTPDPAKAMQLLKEANGLIAADYVVLPLYQQRYFLAYKTSLANIRNAYSFPTYNSEQWGFRKE